MVYDRITPAGAGKTCWRKSVMQRFQDHPRRCGENVAGAEPQRLTAGSPPQVRGKPDEVTAYQEATRITPAGAGKTITLVQSFGQALGSPPQVRGKLHHV